MAERTTEKHQAGTAADPETTAAADGGAPGAVTGSAATDAGTKAGPSAGTAGSGRTSKSGAKSSGGKSSGAGSGKSGTKSGGGKSGGKSAAKNTTAQKATGGSGTAQAGGAEGPAETAPAAAKQSRSAEEVERIREALQERLSELRDEYRVHVAEITELQRDRLTDSAGDDQADTGSKTFEREQEISLAHSIMERTTQVERALERLDEGSYGWCERCQSPIPVERLAAFPSATLCIACKQLEERR